MQSKMKTRVDEAVDAEQTLSIPSDDANEFEAESSADSTR
jgi:hypothetical protein